MAQDDYGPEDRAELIADGLGIKPSSYTGRTADATAAMALVAGYSRMAESDQKQVLYTISERMKFGTTNPTFVDQCRGALSLMISNPGWVPGSLPNDELEKDIAFWRNVKSTLDFFGAPAATTYFASKTPGIFKSLSAGTMPKAPSIATAGPLVFILGARAVTTGSLNGPRGGGQAAWPTRDDDPAACRTVRGPEVSLSLASREWRPRHRHSLQTSSIMIGWPVA